MAQKKSCQLVVHSQHSEDRIFSISQAGWHDALTHASEIARQNPSNLWVAHVDLHCNKGKVAMYKCRREATRHPIEGIPPFVHCELDVTRGSDRVVAGRRKLGARK